MATKNLKKVMRQLKAGHLPNSKVQKPEEKWPVNFEKAQARLGLTPTTEE